MKVLAMLEYNGQNPERDLELIRQYLEVAESVFSFKVVSVEEQNSDD